VQSLRNLSLIGGILGGKAEEVTDAKGFQLREVIPESARLWRASSRAGDQVPSGRVFDSGNSRSRIGINHDSAGKRG
jgi:hypothetical protein